VTIKVSTMTPATLESRVENRKRDLISEIVEHKKNCSRAGAADAIDRAKTKLSELAYIVKTGGAGARTKLQLDEWMAR
jgi:hypothetical protein